MENAINFDSENSLDRSTKEILHTETSTYRIYSAGRIRKIVKKEKLLIILILSVIISFVVGSLTNPVMKNLEEPLKTNIILIMGFPGDLFLRYLKLIIIPLVFCSLVSGIASLDSDSIKKISLYGIIYFITTTFSAVFLGIILAILIQPGKQMTNQQIPVSREKMRTLDILLDIVRNMFPENIFQATFQQTKTVSQPVYQTHIQNVSLPKKWNTLSALSQKKYIVDNNILALDNESLFATQNVSDYYLLPHSSKMVSGMNVMGIIVFAMLFGIFIGRRKQSDGVLLNCIVTICDVLTRIVNLIMLTSPVGVSSLIVVQLWKIDNVSDAFRSLALYVITYMLGLIIHLSIVLHVAYFLITRKNPLTFSKCLLKAGITAFGTASSSATIPVTLICLEKCKIKSKVAKFMVPVGATINMDGTALYEAVAAIFIAQASNISLSPAQIFLTSITSSIASIGAAGVPQGGVVTIVIVLQALGLPFESISLVLSVDWLIDRFRTVGNVIGDAFGAGIVDHIVSSSAEFED